MAYAIERTETLHAALLRISGEQIVRARETLTDRGLPLDERVHDARKRFKEIRALLRLFREPLAEHFPPENSWFRDAARDLSAPRDTAAIVETLQSLDLSRGAFRAARAMLASLETTPPLEPVIAKVVQQLVLAQARPPTWPPMTHSFDAIEPGLGRTYAGGRSGLRSHATPEHLHEWRKRVKDLWYHTQLLREVWPEVMTATAGVLSSLSRALGTHHDLHVLRERLWSADGAEPWFRETGAAIERRQNELEAQARGLAELVFAEKRKAWLARMRKYWIAWQRTEPSTHLRDA